MMPQLSKKILQMTCIMPQCGFHEMTSKDEYMDYLTEKLQTLKEHGVRMEFQVVQGRMHKKALLVTNDEAPEGKFGFVADFNEEGKVKMLNITVQAFF